MLTRTCNLLDIAVQYWSGRFCRETGSRSLPQPMKGTDYAVYARLALFPKPSMTFRVYQLLRRSIFFGTQRYNINARLSAYM